jgi:deoxycytidylate deaminase
MDALIRKTAQRATHLHHHVVVVTKGGAVKSIGFNRNAVHAEVTALSRLWPDQRPGFKVWSFRVRKDGTYAMAKPCPECQVFLQENGIKTVIYSDNDGEFHRLKLQASTKRINSVSRRPAYELGW